MKYKEQKIIDPHYATKEALLTRLANILYTRINRSPFFLRGKPQEQRETSNYKIYVQPRSGLIKFLPGYHGAKIYSSLDGNDKAKLRAAFAEVPGWNFDQGDPRLFWEGSYLCVEADWPEQYVIDNVSLGDIPHRATDGKTALIGMLQSYEIATLYFDQGTDAHLFAVGSTRSGKTQTMLNIIVQLAIKTGPRFVIVDGRGGPQSLHHCLREHGLRGLEAPVALTHTAALNAIGHVYREMLERKAGKSCAQPFYFIADEVHEFAKMPLFADILLDLALQGGAMNIHLFLATQRAESGVLGEHTMRIKAQILQKILHVLNSPYDVQTVTGSQEPPAHKLQGYGDAYWISKRYPRYQRVQIAKPTDRDLERVAGPPAHAAYPQFLPDDYHREIENWEAPRYTQPQMQAALWCATIWKDTDGRSGGRGTLRDLLAAIGHPERSNDNVDDLLKIGREQHGKFARAMEA